MKDPTKIGLVYSAISAIMKHQQREPQMSKILIPQTLFTLVGITADGSVVPVHYDPDIGRYSRSVAELELESRGYRLNPEVFCNADTYRAAVTNFKPNEDYYPGVVRLEVREFRFV